MPGSCSAKDFTFWAVSTGLKQEQGYVLVLWDKNVQDGFHHHSLVNGIALKCGLEAPSYPFHIF